MDVCPICNTKFKRKYIKGKQRQVCCSKKCRWILQYKNLPISNCKTCGKKFKAHPLRQYKDYCSLACIQRSPCQFCGKMITGRKTFQSGEKKFCGRQCSNAGHRIQQGTKNYVTRGFIQTIQRFGKIMCEKCKETNTHYLTVHHIDEKRKNNANKNLITLCANCHHSLHLVNSKKHLQNISVALFYTENISS